MIPTRFVEPWCNHIVMMAGVALIAHMQFDFEVVVLRTPSPHYIHSLSVPRAFSLAQLKHFLMVHLVVIVTAVETTYVGFK